MTQKAKGVRTLHPQYEKMLPLWEKCMDAVEGEDAVHKASTKYLPKLRAEDDKDYNARLARTPFFNATWRTISGLKGMIFRKDAVFEEPPALESYLKDVDMAGTPLDMFSQSLVEDVLTVGRSGVLVDYPPAVEPGATVTVAQAAKLGMRPMLQKYNAVDIINWKTSRIGNVVKLTLVVLMEKASVEGDDEFAQDAETRYRVLDIVEGVYRQRVYRINKDDKEEQVGGDLFPLMNNKPMDKIPFVFFGADDSTADPDSPPLLDLVQMNFHHYTVSADYEHGCHWSGLPTLFVFGLQGDTDKPIYIGGAAANCVQDPQGHAEYAQVDSGFDALQHNLEQKENQMAILGARMLESKKSAVEAAETLKQRSAGEQSQLAGMAVIISLCMTRVLSIFAQWAGVDAEIDYQLNRDFDVSGMSAQELTALVAAWQSGMPGASGPNVYALMQSREMADPTVTYEEEQGRIDSQAPTLLGTQVA